MSETIKQMEALAITFLTGQASQDETAEYKRLFETNEEFRKTVSEIGLWLAPLNEGAVDLPVSDGLLGSIMAEIDKLEETDTETRPAQTVPANDRSGKGWKYTAIAASLVAALSIGSHFIDVEGPPADNNQQLMALLSDNTQPQLMAIVYDPASGRVVARLSNITIPDDGDLQLWLIREGEGAPVSLGVLDRAKADNQIEFEIPKTLQSKTDVLAVSLEALGGSKAAGPEGPVLFTGNVSELHGSL